MTKEGIGVQVGAQFAGFLAGVRYMLRRTIIALTLSLVIIMLAGMSIAHAASNSTENKQLFEYYKSIYPCTKCHAHMPQLNGMVKKVPFHHIDLTKGPHRGLYCANCHIPPTFINLRGGARVYIPGLHNRTLVMQTNKLCAICHPREYQDYLDLIHGNKTFTCPGGKVIIIHGYKGINYYYHICPDGYKHLETLPARACVECHNPHDPVVKPLNILPTPSERPAPPKETSIAIGDVLALVGGLIAVGIAFVVHYAPPASRHGDSDSRR